MGKIIWCFPKQFQNDAICAALENEKNCVSALCARNEPHSSIKMIEEIICTWTELKKSSPVSHNRERSKKDQDMW